MFVIGGVGLCCGVCCIGLLRLTPVSDLIAQSGIDFAPLQQAGLSPETFFRVVYGIMAVTGLVGSLLLIVLGVFVRKGSMGAIITSIVLASLMALLLVINAITGLVQLAGVQSSSALAGLITVLVFLGLFIVLLTWLAQAARGVSAMRAAQMQYQAQYLQYMQQQQAYGYAQQPPQQQPVPQQPPPVEGGPDGTSTQG